MKCRKVYGSDIYKFQNIVCIVNLVYKQQNIWFNKTCIKKGLISKYMFLLSNSKYVKTTKLIKAVRKNWLKNKCCKSHILNTYQEISNVKLNITGFGYSWKTGEEICWQNYTYKVQSTPQ